jgi:ABC-type nickel/cobalt efflux system permease component RcnA
MVDVFSPVVLAIALVLGLEHAFDADHIVAISTILGNTKSVRKSLFLGTMWGLGHTVTIFIVGIVVLALRVVIPQSIVNIFEAAAAVLLIFLGVYVIRGLLIERRAHKSENFDPHLHPENEHEHEHTHDGHTHHHPHAHSHDQKGHDHTHMSLFAGAIQGLGGSAAIMLVALSTVGSALIGVVFILIFGLGVILGMLGIGALIGGLLKFTAVHVEKIHYAIRAIAGSISITFGLLIILSILLTGKTFL